MASLLTRLSQEKSASQMQTLSRQSFKWLSQKVSEIRNPQTIASGLNREKQRYVKKFMVGGLYCFYYNPKGINTLPYYDQFPLVIPLQYHTDSFLGLNLHYLPIKYRVAFLDKLSDYATYDNNNEIERVRVSYDILSASKRFREFKPCIKKYLTSQIQSRIIAIQPDEWETAVFLPMHQFKGASPQEVWQDSLEEMRK